MSEEYNGWKNYETWLAYCHLTNTPWLYKSAKKVAKEKGAEGLRDFVEDSLINAFVCHVKVPGRVDPESWFEALRTLLHDMSFAACRRVDWDRISEVLCEE